MGAVTLTGGSKINSINSINGMGPIRGLGANDVNVAWQANAGQWASQYYAIVNRMINSQTADSTFWGVLWDLVNVGIAAMTIAHQWKVFKLQEKLMDRQIRLAEDLRRHQESTFWTYERQQASDICAYFRNPYRPQYDVQIGRLEAITKQAFAKQRAQLLACSNRFCQPATMNMLKDLSIGEANALVDAANNAYRFEDAQKIKYDEYWRNLRSQHINQGQGLSGQIANTTESAYSLARAQGDITRGLMSGSIRQLRERNFFGNLGTVNVQGTSALSGSESGSFDFDFTQTKLDAAASSGVISLPPAASKPISG